MIAEPAGSDRYGCAMADVLHDASHPRATRVERSFALVDLSGFTRFTDVQGDDEAVDILSAFRAVVRGVASTHGVRIANGWATVRCSSASNPNRCWRHWSRSKG